MSRLDDEVTKLRSAYDKANTTNKDKLYKELLEQYEEAQTRIAELEKSLSESKNKLPSKEEVDTMSSMIDLINKLDESTIEKLSEFGSQK